VVVGGLCCGGVGGWSVGEGGRGGALTLVAALLDLSRWGGRGGRGWVVWAGVGLADGGAGGGLDDGAEVVGFEGGAADESAVDVGLGDEFGGVGGFHAAAVEDAGALRGGVVEDVGEDFAALCVSVLCVVGCGGFAGADGPDGFVGDDDSGGVGGGDAVEGGAELSFVDGVGFAGFALFDGFADAEDWAEAGVECGAEFVVEELVLFADDVASFGVSDEDGGAVEVSEHVGGDFACEGAVGLVVDVLCAEGESCGGVVGEPCFGGVGGSEAGL